MKVAGVTMRSVLLMLAVLSTVAFKGEPEETVIRGLAPDKACEKIRAMKADKTFPDHDVVVELEGTYSFTGESFTLGREDGGVSPNARVVFRGPARMRDGRRDNMV